MQTEEQEKPDGKAEQLTFGTVDVLEMQNINQGSRWLVVDWKKRWPGGEPCTRS